MAQENNSVKELWNNYLMSIGQDVTGTNMKYDSWHFCDNEKDADELAELVRQGIKGQPPDYTFSMKWRTKHCLKSEI